MTIFLVMIATHSIADAKAHLTACIISAEAGERVVLTRHGKPVAALVSMADLAVLEKTADNSPQAGLAGLIGAWEEDEEMEAAVKSVIASRTGPRPLPIWE
jgi:prevent-host-death family protein